MEKEKADVRRAIIGGIGNRVQIAFRKSDFAVARVPLGNGARRLANNSRPTPTVGHTRYAWSLRMRRRSHRKPTGRTRVRAMLFSFPTLYNGTRRKPRERQVWLVGRERGRFIQDLSRFARRLSPLPAV